MVLSHKHSASVANGFDDEDDEYEDEFDDVFGELGQDIRQGHHMTDIFDKARTGSSFYERFTGAMKDVSYLMHFYSPIIAHYYMDVTECLIKRKVRQFLKLLTAYWCVILTKSLRYPEPSMSTFTSSAFLMSLFIVLYIATFRNLSRNEYKLISLFLTIASLTYTLYESCRQESSIDGYYAYPFSLVIMIIVFLPLDMQVVLPILVIFCAIFVIISARKMTYSLLKRDLYEASPQPIFTQGQVYRFQIVHEGVETWSIFAEDYCMVQICSWVTVILFGCYQRFWNELRRRSAFSIIGKSVRARNQIKTSLENQKDWISAIMPLQVQNQYISMRKANEATGNIWVFSKSFDEVSILFADIVGFTKMSSTKTATKMVMLLNDLYGRFDDLSTEVNCEKIGTLGDCYYAVAGCPVERDDHAVSCVEFGLGMCRLIKLFNKDNGEQVNMRVGVHTGRVNAAIIGNNRFRYDVYSTDVIIANNMETYGLPGRVHISETTYKFVKHIYRFARGPPLPIIKEQQLGIGGLEQVEVDLKTYFVDPLSSLLRKKNETYGHTGAPSRVLTLQDDTENDDMSSDDEEETSGVPNPVRKNIPHLLADGSANLAEEAEQRRLTNIRDIRLIQALHEDPKRQVDLFRNAPLTPFFQHFISKTVEYGFRSYMRGSAPIVTVESPRLAPLIDAVSVVVATIAITIPYLIQFSEESGDQFWRVTIIFMLAIFMSFVLTVILILGTKKRDIVVIPEGKGGFAFFMGSLFRESILALLTLIPTFVFLSQTSIVSTKDESKMMMYLAFGMMCIQVHCMATSSCSWVRGLCILFSGCSFALVVMDVHENFDYTYCEPLLWYVNLSNPIEGLNERIAAGFTLIAVAYFITIENERSLRVWYYVLREAETACKTAVKESEAAQQLLDNVIPRYIFTQLASRGHKRLKAGTFCFANSVPDVAVTFATLTNFFKSYYREDYRGGEGALKLLNTIICAFDELMAKPRYASVEKIKTINDCYMIAAGLNQLQREKTKQADKHIFDLLEYDFELYRVLNDINENYIIGTDKFEMKIGYYIGDVTAGIIGFRKPIYDIWGNTVNVASRMYSTGHKGKVQIPEEVKDRLGDRYDYVYRGEVFVKGKGNMRTFFVHPKGYIPDPDETIDSVAS